MQRQQQATTGGDNGVTIPPQPRLQRVKRPDLPNKAAHNEQIAALYTQIDLLQHRIQEIKSTLDNKHRHVASPQLTDARNKLADLNAEFKSAVDMKRRHREELDLVKEKLRNSSRSGLPDVSVEALNEEIRNLEYRQTHTTLSIDEEKRLVVQINRLRKSRDSLHHHDNRVEHDQASRAELIELIKKDEEKLNSLKAEQEQQRRILAELRDKEAALAHDIPSLIQERNSAYEKIKDLREDIKQLKADYAVKEDQYWNQEKEWRAQQAVERKLKAEKSRAEWLERERIRKQRALENFVEPYTHEIILCEQLISYMHKNAPLDDEAAVPQLQQKAEILTPEGFGVAIVSKKNRNEDDLDGWFAGSGGKKGKKGKGSAPSKCKVREKLSLSIDALSSFEKIKVSPPMTYDDVAKSIEELKRKKDDFLALQKKAKEASEREESVETGGADGVTSETSGEEPVAESTPHDIDNGSHGEHDVPSSDANMTELETIIGSQQVVQEETDNEELNKDAIKLHLEFVEDVDINEGHIEDRAHLESFEFSEAKMGSKAIQDLDDVLAVEEVVENGISKEGLDQVSNCANEVHSHAIAACVAKQDTLEESCNSQVSAVESENSFAEGPKAVLQMEDSTEVLESMEVLQAAESKSDKGQPSKDVEASIMVESTQVVGQKVAQLDADSAMDSSATRVTTPPEIEH